MARTRVAVLISGSGSNFEALARSCEEPESPAEIVCVISNKSGVAGLERGRRLGLPARVIDQAGLAGPGAFDAELHAHLAGEGIDLLCLAGFMRILGEPFVTRWHNRILNVHPSLLPAFKGLNTHRRALQAGVALAGCTVHLVRPDLDDGPILVQGIVPVLEGDDEGSLAARVLELEHQCYPLALRLWAKGEITCTPADELCDRSTGRRFTARLLCHPILNSRSDQP